MTVKNEQLFHCFTSQEYKRRVLLFSFRLNNYAKNAAQGFVCCSFSHKCSGQEIHRREHICLFLCFSKVQGFLELSFKLINSLSYKDRLTFRYLECCLRRRNIFNFHQLRYVYQISRICFFKKHPCARDKLGNSAVLYSMNGVQANLNSKHRKLNQSIIDSIKTLQTVMNVPWSLSRAKYERKFAITAEYRHLPHVPKTLARELG